MPILETDIKLKRAQVMDDTDYGGGQMSNVVVQNGVSNQVFDDIAELDYVYGSVSVRKVYSAVDTPTSDVLLKSSIIVTREPTDPLVSVTLFSTNDWFDRRSDARDKIERYLAPAERLSGHLLENMLAGQRTIEIAMREEDAVPNVGQGLVIVENETLVTQYEQYVRVTKVNSVMRNFTVGTGGSSTTISRKVLIVEISDPLRLDFHGCTVSEFETGFKPKAIVRNTRVADAARYYGVKNMAAAATIGQNKVKVDSIFSQIVPSAQAESPMVDIPATGSAASLTPANNSSINITQTAVPISTGLSIYLGSPIYPSTLYFTLDGVIISDIGGSLSNPSGGVIGTVDHINGRIIWTETIGTRNLIFTLVPAAVDYRSSNTYGVPIDQDNRGFNYVRTFLPAPSPTTLIVSYVAQNNVYVLRDDGNGRIAGADSAYGSGTINYGSGTMSLTLGALPDSGSTIIYSWGTNVSSFVRSNQPLDPFFINVQLNHQSIAPNTVSISWAGGNSASDDGSGAISGSGVGEVDYFNGRVKLHPNTLPNKGSTLTINYDYGASEQITQNFSATNGSHTFTIAGSGALIEESVEIEVLLKHQTEVGLGYGFSYPVEPKLVRMRDKPSTITAGQGDMVDTSTGGVVGSINYATRTITIAPTATAKGYSISYVPERASWPVTSP